MILRFCSGSVTPASLPRNRSLGVAMDQRDVVMVAEQPHHLLALALAQQAVVDEDAVKLARRSPRGSAPRRPRNRRRPKGRRSPGPCPPGARMRSIACSRKAAMVQSPLQPAMSRTKLLQQLAALGRVHDLGMEHQAVIFAPRRRRRWQRARPRWRPRRESRAAASSPGRHGSSTPARARPSSTRRRTARSRRRRRRRRGRIRDGRRARPCRRAGRTASAGRSRCRAAARPSRRRSRARAACPSLVTEAGPPERMMPRGSKSRDARRDRC